MSDDVRDAGFDEWLDAAEEGEAYYIECPAEHGSLPPRRVCPDCGSMNLTQKNLPNTGKIETFTITHVSTPAFKHDTPYATAVGDFGPVRLTGQIITDDLEVIKTGRKIAIKVTTSEATSGRVLGFKII